jgi:hypothetical protein
MLGHRKLDVTIRFYTGLETDRAAETFQNAVLTRQDASRLTALAGFARRGRSPRKRQGRGG